MYLNLVFFVLLGIDEIKNECLKFLMFIYLFRQKVFYYESFGVNFREYLYVFEVDLIGVDFYEREDYNYLLKCIVVCIWSGGVFNINLRCFTEVLNDFIIGLIYIVLIG